MSYSSQNSNASNRGRSGRGGRGGSNSNDNMPMDERNHRDQTPISGLQSNARFGGGENVRTGANNGFWRGLLGLSLARMGRGLLTGELMSRTATFGGGCLW
ncbi:unnamed protein product [Cuscuta epithymum]|uniref:Uncharacterized protein n=1 Tax=Cuscuta epithymum TaxID=186058 RepID=A0AAV0GFI5_9ASTE|nr:unnamed protein product [Cuscuta epithymum]